MNHFLDIRTVVFGQAGLLKMAFGLGIERGDGPNAASKSHAVLLDNNIIRLIYCIRNLCSSMLKSQKYLELGPFACDTTSSYHEKPSLEKWSMLTAG